MRVNENTARSIDLISRDQFSSILLVFVGFSASFGTKLSYHLPVRRQFSVYHSVNYTLFQYTRLFLYLLTFAVFQKAVNLNTTSQIIKPLILRENVEKF